MLETIDRGQLLQPRFNNSQSQKHVTGHYQAVQLGAQHCWLHMSKHMSKLSTCAFGLQAANQ
jgi:hypothetical protein